MIDKVQHMMIINVTLYVDQVAIIILNKSKSNSPKHGYRNSRKIRVHIRSRIIDTERHSLKL